MSKKITVVSDDHHREKFTTLDAALASAGDGDTVVLKQGTYDINSLVMNEDLSISGSPSGKTVLDGGILLTPEVETFSISDVTIENGASILPDWDIDAGLYAQGSTDITVDDVTFTDTVFNVDDPSTYMVGISARTALPGEGSVFTITDSTFDNLANGVDVENGVSASIDNSTFVDAAVVTNQSNTEFANALSITNSTFTGDSGIVFVEGNTWSDLTLVNNTGDAVDYYIYGAAADPVVLQDQGDIDVQLQDVTILGTSPYFDAA